MGRSHGAFNGAPLFSRQGLHRLLIKASELQHDPGDIVLGSVRQRAGGLQSLIEQFGHNAERTLFLGTGKRRRSVIEPYRQNRLTPFP